MTAGAVALWIALAVGCHFKGAGAETPDETMSDYWRPEAAALRIYPATRFTQSDGRTMLEARIELQDEMDDAVKAAGAVRLELFNADDTAGDSLGGRLYRWDVTMRTLADQRTYFDPVTRTYLFRLEVDDPGVAQRDTVLRATFTRASDGRQLEAEAPVARR